MHLFCFGLSLQAPAMRLYCCYLHTLHFRPAYLQMTYPPAMYGLALYAHIVEPLFFITLVKRPSQTLSLNEGC